VALATAGGSITIHSPASSSLQREGLEAHVRPFARRDEQSLGGWAAVVRLQCLQAVRRFRQLRCASRDTVHAALLCLFALGAGIAMALTCLCPSAAGSSIPGDFGRILE